MKLYNQEKIKCSEYLSGQTVNFKVDGWSNVYNKPILWGNQQKKGENYLVDKTDVFGSSYNVEHFEDIVKNSTINYKK